MSSPLTDPALLLAHDGRLRALARELVRDGGAAEDLAQETWLAALERGADVRSLPAWLATVARRLATKERRSLARRERREESVARPEAGPSTAEILEREEARRRVVEALVRLDEPLRATLVLRFLEDLPPRAVAKRMGVPVETVRTRTRRGLDALRAALDRDFGARERWLSALVPFVRLPRSPIGPTLAAMSLQTKLASSLAVLALLAWTVWPRETRPASVPPATVARAPEVAQPDAPGPGLAAPTGEASGTRVLAPVAGAPEPIAADPTGALRVRVTWPDGTGAAGVGVRVASGEENPDLNALDGTTDEAGSALFEGLPVGTARVAVDRHLAPPSAVELTSGATAEIEIELGLGFNVAGIVVAEQGGPVPGAEVWLGKYADLAHGTCVARSADDGSFFLRALTHANLGARAPGYRPSKIEYVRASHGAVVDVVLVLRPGGSEVLGSVSDGSGQPVPGALVRVGPPGPNGGLEGQDADWGTLVRTDEQGRFRAAGLASGPCPIVVRCAGFALFRGEVELPEGGCAGFQAVLAPEAALEGHVRDSLGVPVSGALVRVGEDGVGEEGGPLAASGRTREDGSFRIGALEAGRTLTAWVDDDRGNARTEFFARTGHSETWEAVLDAGGEIRGRVLDEHGGPLAGWRVGLQDQEPSLDPDEAVRVTTADGGFAFTDVHDRPHHVSLTAPRAGAVMSLARFGVRPGSDELVLRVTAAMVPSARIVGTFLDEEGRPIPTAQIWPWALAFTWVAIETCDPRTGRFDLGPFPAGSVKLLLKAPGRGMLVRGPHELLPGETWDVGEVRLAADGRLCVRLVPLGLAPGEELQLSLSLGHFNPDAFEGAGLERLSPPLAPGAHTLFVGGGEYEELALPFEVRSDAETVLDVPLRRGWRTQVAVRAPESSALGFLRVSLPGGAALEHMLWERTGEHWIESLHLPAGTFTVEATAGDHRASGTLVVEPVDRDEPALVLEPE